MRMGVDVMDSIADKSLAKADQPSATLLAWEPGESGIEAIEQDIRKLMRQLGEAQFQMAEKEKANAGEVKDMLLALLEITDAFDRVFLSIHAKEDQVTPQMKRWIGNFRTIRRLVDGVLSAQGVVRIENLDYGFDPRWHVVEDTVHDPSKPDGTIVEEVKPGYVWRNKILRETVVRVVRNDALAEDSSSG